MVMTVQLPIVLTQSEDYLELTEKQSLNFQSRMNYILEITDNITEWLNGKGNWASLEAFLDDLELDVSVNQNLNTGDDYISSWLIHNSWGDGVEEKASLAKLPVDVLASLDADLPELRAQDTEVNAWLEGLRDALRRVLETLLAANNFAEVLSSILAMDMLMVNLLAGLYKLRFR